MGMWSPKDSKESLKTKERVAEIWMWCWMLTSLGWTLCLSLCIPPSIYSSTPPFTIHPVFRTSLSDLPRNGYHQGHPTGNGVPEHQQGQCGLPDGLRAPARLWGVVDVVGDQQRSIKLSGQPDPWGRPKHALARPTRRPGEWHPGDTQLRPVQVPRGEKGREKEGGREGGVRREGVGQQRERKWKRAGRIRIRIRISSTAKFSLHKQTRTNKTWHNGSF